MKHKILIADDEPEIRDLLRLYLENEGYEVTEAKDGAEALRFLRDTKPDLCILDIMMPQTDGYQVLKKLRETSNIPVIFLSAKDADSEKILGLNLGADDYIAKPFNPLEAVARVNSNIRRFYSLGAETEIKQDVIKIKDLELKNPVMTASGTFGYGLEFADLMPLDGIGGIIVKGTTLKPREGNDYPRMAETASGMLNCVGLQNKGVDYFCEHIYPQIKDINTNMIVNVSGSSPEDYAECAARIDALENIPAIELNISCPNVRDGGMAFGVTCAGASSVVKAVRQAYHKTLIVKLSPNVTDITEIARAVEAEGADAV